jgi:transcriptional regulator with XRE-family HTH domain
MEKSYFGSNLRYLRKLKGLTQGEYGEVVSLKKSRVSLLESGEDPTLYILRVTADYFNVTLDEIVRKDLQNPIDDPPPKNGKTYYLNNGRNTEGINGQSHTRMALVENDVGERGIEGESPPPLQYKKVETEGGGQSGGYLEDRVKRLEQLLLTQNIELV